MTESDKNIVDNLRREYGQAIANYTDEQVALAWRYFSQSDEYHLRNKDKTIFPLWCEAERNNV